MIKILVVLSGGILPDGISSAWYSLAKSIKNSQRSQNLDITFLDIEENRDAVMVEKFRELGYKILPTPVRRSKPLTYLKNLTKILKNEKFDFIHVNGSTSLMILEMIAAKLAHVENRIAHSRNTTCGNKGLHKLLFYPFNSMTNIKLACGEDAGKWLFGNSQFKIFHNGIDLNKFKFNSQKRVEVRKELNLTDEDFAIGHVGRFNFQKNHEFLIEVFAEVLKINPKSRLFLFGNGKLFDDIKNKVKEKGLEGNVTFMGVKSDINSFLQAMDFMLLPSRNEGLPNVVVEWQAAGLPSILSNCITKECAVTPLVDFMSLNDSPGLWAKKVLEKIDFFKDRVEDSKKAIKALKLEGFDIEVQAERLLEIYNS